MRATKGGRKGAGSRIIFLLMLLASGVIHTISLIQIQDLDGATTTPDHAANPNHVQLKIQAFRSDDHRKKTASAPPKDAYKPSPVQRIAKRSKADKNTSLSANVSISTSTAAAKSEGNGLGQFYLEPHSGIGAPMNLAEQLAHTSNSKFDAMTTIPAETKAAVMPSILKIAREIRMQFDIPMLLRAYLAGQSGSINLSIDQSQNWHFQNPRGNPYLRSLLFDRLIEMRGDPLVTDAFRSSELISLRIKARVLLPETDGNHCKQSGEDDLEIDGYQISLIFRPPCPQKSVAYHLIAAQNDAKTGQADVSLNILSILSIPAELAARERAEKDLHRTLKKIRQSPAFSGKLPKTR